MAKTAAKVKTPSATKSKGVLISAETSTNESLVFLEQIRDSNAKICELREANYNRAKEDLEKRVGSPQDVANAQIDWENAKIKLAEAQIKILEEKAKIKTTSVA